VVTNVGTIGGEERLNSRLRWWFFGFDGWYSGAQEIFWGRWLFFGLCLKVTLFISTENGGVVEW
jgi:hypothetical protein